jgi:hypothetical protein
MTSRTSPPFKILFEKLIRTHHSCKSKKTPVYSYLKSIMLEKPRFEVHLLITKSNWNFQVWLFEQERLWKSYRLRPGLITKSHALLDNLNSVIKFCQDNGKATRSSRCCNWCHTSDTPSYDQDIVMHPTEFYRMSMKEHIATSNSRQKSSVNLDVTQHIWRKRPATKIPNILLATRGKPRVHRTPSLLATKQDCAPGTHSITSHWRIVHQSIHHPTSYRAFTKQHLAKMVTAFEKEGSPMLGPSG